MENSVWWKDNRDAPWWYNERASISLFAGALWRCDEWAFEEYRITKHITTRKQKRKIKAGRGDIMFGIKGEGFIAEVKQCYPVIQANLHKSIKDTKDCLQVACRESYRQPSHGARRVGMVFAVPRIRISRKNKMTALIDEFIKRIQKQFKKATIAWVFPLDKLYSLKSRNYHYPGVILIARPFKKKSSKKPYYGKLHKVNP